MRVSMEWLRELVPVELTVPELADLLDMTGTAVEGIETVGAALEGVVVGLILTKDRHPDAEKLWVTTVGVGSEAPLTIVCGAQNFEAGDIVPVALVGATLPNGVTIKKAKLRGIESQGMNCSAAELGLGVDASGLLILPADAPVGDPFAEYWGLANTVLDLEITPNRPDCLSVAGVAREVGALTGKPSRWPSSTPEERGTAVEELASAAIEDPTLCLRYTLRVVSGVTVGPSPDWLIARLRAAGARPINNIVDVTNYVMFELGQPLHAFDLDTIGSAGGRAAISVRTAKPGETLVTLDGKNRRLESDTLCITDPTGVIALAGVMGGANTEVSDATTNVLLESASFSPTSTSRTSRKLGLFSEASSRFEKGVDAAGCAAAANRAAALIAEIAGGAVAPGIVDAYPTPACENVLLLRVDRVNALLGTRLPESEIASILRRLGLAVRDLEPGVLEITVPTFRPDLEREVDLIEEVVRVHGMGNVVSTLPAGRGRVGGLSRDQRWREVTAETLRATGLNETVTFTFADPADMDRLGWRLAEGEQPVELLNPMSEEQAVLRWTLAPGLLRQVSNNLRRGTPDVHLYEVGTVFSTVPGRKQAREGAVVGGVLAGSWHPLLPVDQPFRLEFFDGRGVLEALMERLGVERWKLAAIELPWLQSGRAAEVIVAGERIGWLGEVAPSVLDAYETSGPVVLFELALEPLVRAAVDVRAYEELSRFPAVELDVALVVPEDVTAEQIERAIVSAGGTLLDSVRLFDVYRDDEMRADGRKSLAFALMYRAPDRTLTAEEVEPVHEKLVKKVTGAVGGELRG